MIRIRALACLALIPALAPAATDLPLARLLLPRSAQFAGCEGEIRKVPIDPEPIGYSGPRFDRFDIHLDSLDEIDRNRVRAWGKTRFHGSVCSFEGTFQRTHVQVAEANTRIEGIFQRNVVRVDLKETGCPAPGRIDGELVGWSFALPGGKVTFATDLGIEECARGIKGNQFTGTWKALKGKSLRKVRWGWRRPPEAEGLDCGTEEFFPCARVVDSSWSDYTVARNCRPDDTAAACARARLRESWWKDSTAVR